MLSHKIKNRQVIELHKGKPHIRTEVTFLTPIAEEDVIKFTGLMLHNELNNTLRDMTDKVEELVGDTFECDIESIYVGVKNTL